MAQSQKPDVAELNADVALQMSILRDDIASLTATVADFGKAQASHMKSTASQKASDLADSGAATAEAMRAKAEQTYSDTERAVRDNPGTAIGIAAGLGFLVGMLTVRR